MAVHFSLDFMAPFGVGDIVYTTFPPGAHEYVGGPASYKSLKAVVLTIKLRLDLGADNNCLLSEPMSDRSIDVRQVIYTLKPISVQELSPFEVEWSTEPDSEPTLFEHEDQLVASQQIS
jgi:hypothetical protein